MTLSRSRPKIFSCSMMRDESFRTYFVYRFLYIYNFIHHQTMIANSEKKQQIEIIKNINYHRTKSVTTQPIFSSKKNITSFSQDSTGQVKIELHTTIINGFYIFRFKQFHEEAIDNKL